MVRISVPARTALVTGVLSAISASLARWSPSTPSPPASIHTPYGFSSLVTVAVATVWSRSSLIGPSSLTDHQRRRRGPYCHCSADRAAWPTAVGYRGIDAGYWRPARLWITSAV